MYNTFLCLANQISKSWQPFPLHIEIKTPTTYSPLLIANNSSLKPILVLIIFLPKLHRESNISSPNPCDWPHGDIRVSPIRSEKAMCHILWYQYWHQHGYLHAQLYMHYCWCLQEWQPELQRDILYPIYMHWLISGQFLKTRIFMDPTILKCAIVHPHHLI